MKTYSINEIFYAQQGEGHRAGTMNVFIRFAGCNLQCVDKTKLLGRPLQGREIDAGFNCDTDFAKGEKLTVPEILDRVHQADRGGCRWIILTGGEPTLQLDYDLLMSLYRAPAGHNLALETNGTRAIDGYRNLLAWISCSPKPGTGVVIRNVDEVRCVVRAGESPMTMGLEAGHLFVSPACDAPTADMISGWSPSVENFNRAAMDWAVKWCEEHPAWRISLQLHKILGVK